MNYFSIVLSVLVHCCINNLAHEINPKELKCLVCKVTVEELEKAVSQIDPKKRVEIGNYRLDPDGNQPKKTVELRRSQLYLTELLEKICKTMEDYIRTVSKKTGKLKVLRLISESGGVNPLIGDYEVVQDHDLNKSLEFYCQSIVEEYEDGIIKHLTANSDHMDIRICSEEAKLCNQTIEEDYEFETHDENEHEEL